MLNIGLDWNRFELNWGGLGRDEWSLCVTMRSAFRMRRSLGPNDCNVPQFYQDSGSINIFVLLSSGEIRFDPSQLLSV